MNLPHNMENDEIICQCFQVNENTIRATIAKDNLTEIDEVTERCEAGGGCHSCHILIQLFLDEQADPGLPNKDQDSKSDDCVGGIAQERSPPRHSIFHASKFNGRCRC